VSAWCPECAEVLLCPRCSVIASDREQLQEAEALIVELEEQARRQKVQMVDLQTRLHSLVDVECVRELINDRQWRYSVTISDGVIRDPRVWREVVLQTQDAARGVLGEKARR